MRVRWTRTALKNLNQEAQYIARDNPGAASHFIARIQEVVELLENQPKMGRPGRVRGTRELIVSGIPYILPYRIREKTIEILRVFHTSRKLPE